MHLRNALLVACLLLPSFTHNVFSEPGGKTVSDLRAHQFSQLDLSGDGEISKSEFVEWYLQRLDTHFARLDTDSNESISKDEFLSRGNSRRPPLSRPDDYPNKQPLE